MAAHALTGVQQILEDIKQDRLNVSHLEGAINFSCFTDDDITLWDHINRFVNGKLDLEEFVIHLHYDLVRLRAIHAELGQPSTREEWLSRKWNTPIEKLHV